MRNFRSINRICLLIFLITIIPISGFPSNSSPSDLPSSVSIYPESVSVHGISGYTQAFLPSAQTAATGSLFVNPDNPRYFTDGTLVNGKYKAIFLTGSHTWCNFMDCDDNASIPAKFDYSAYLNFLESKNHNFFRLWRAENVRGGENGDDFWFDPMPYQRSATCCAFDGKNKFNLNQFNQAYFDRMRQRVIQARDRGIYVSIMLFDGWSVETKFPSTHQPWKGHPYNINNNINNIDGDVNNDNQGDETHTLAISAVTTLQEAYVRKVIDTVNDLDNVLYEISNESRGGAENRLWQYHMINYIKTYESGKPKQHPVGMTIPWPDGSNTDLLNSPADWISPNIPNNDLSNPPIANGTKVVLADTDHLCGICGDRQWVWKSFTRGENPIFMDIYDNATSGRGIPFYNPNETEIRNNLGYVRSYANRMNLADMAPTSNTSLCSTGFCLRNAVANGAEYLVYRPTDAGDITVNLSAVSSSKSLNVEWLRPQTGTIYSGEVINGGGTRSFTSPFSGDAVLYIYDSVTSTFSDVPLNYWAWNYIEGLYASGITGGCAINPLRYCPESDVTRAQMAVFLLKGVHGSSYTPPAVGSSTGFADVPTSYWAAPWIKQLAAEGITGGCGGGNFCPDTPVTRAQMAVFLLKSKHGVSYTPPAATGVFADVPVGYWADKWIEQLAAEGITGGCGGGNYCPDTPVTRAQMAVFLVKTFGIPLP